MNNEYHSFKLRKGKRLLTYLRTRGEGVLLMVGARPALEVVLFIFNSEVVLFIEGVREMVRFIGACAVC